MAGGVRPIMASMGLQLVKGGVMSDDDVTDMRDANALYGHARATGHPLFL